MADYMKRTGRLHKSADALSQWVNVSFLRRHEDTDADDSVSGRCFWEANHGARHWTWRWAERAINMLFWRDAIGGKGHCELADLRDYERALTKVRHFEGRRPE